MGTVSDLKDWLRRKAQASAVPITVSPFGFAVGETVVAWQAVSEVWGCHRDPRPGGEGGAWLEFVASGVSVSVGEEQPGFAALEAATVAAFPGTARWREAVLARAPEPMRLFRRA